VHADDDDDDVPLRAFSRYPPPFLSLILIHPPLFHSAGISEGFSLAPRRPAARRLTVRK